MTKVYICEKKNQAENLANVLGKPLLRSGFFEVGEDYVVFLAGHILGLFMPADYDIKYKKYALSNLPIIPSIWSKKLLPGDRYKNMLKTVDVLLKKADLIINVGDPDREGHLLIQEVLEYLQCKKPVQRLLINALDTKSIKSALEVMSDNYSVKNQSIYAAALARQRADWLIGMNASQKYSLALNKTMRVGRVKAPVIAMVIRRNESIDNFKAIKYYPINGVFRPTAALPFSATWQPAPDQSGLDEEGRLIDITIAREIEQKITRKTGKISKIEKTEEKEPAPLPHSLSTLQSLAGRKFKLKPDMVLDICQKLYEAKLTTYPRSGSNYLPVSQFEDATTIINNLKVAGDTEILSYAQNADFSIKSRAFNDKKIEAHHAIIPTTVRVDLTKLSENERKIYGLIAKYYLMQFYPEFKFEKTVVLIDIVEEQFKATGRVILQNGWKLLVKEDIANSEEADEQNNEKILPSDLVENQELTATKIMIAEKETKPLPRFTASTLAEAMQKAHKYTKDPGLSKTLQNIKGIGTEATRAHFVPQLIKAGMLYEKKEGKGEYLFASEEAKEMIKFLPETLTYPDETALMEQQLDQIASGELNLKEYMDKTEQYIRDLVNLPDPECKNTYKSQSKVDGPECPICKKGSLILFNGKNGKFWSCSAYKQGCKARFTNIRNKPAIHKCPKCNNGYLVQRTSKTGKFWGCNNYPECKATFKDEKSKPIFK